MDHRYRHTHRFTQPTRFSHDGARFTEHGQESRSGTGYGSPGGTDDGPVYTEGGGMQENREWEEQRRQDEQEPSWTSELIAIIGLFGLVMLGWWFSKP